MIQNSQHLRSDSFKKYFLLRDKLVVFYLNNMEKYSHNLSLFLNYILWLDYRS